MDEWRSRTVGVVLLVSCACTGDGSGMKDQASAQGAPPGPVSAPEPSTAPGPITPQQDPPGTPNSVGAPSAVPGDPQAGSEPTADAPGSSLRASPTGGLGRPDRKGADQVERGGAVTPAANRANGAAPAGGETGRSDHAPR